MKQNQPKCEHPWTRRGFLRGTVAAVSASCLSPAFAQARGDELAFTASGPGYTFDTGVLKGTLRSQGKSRGLLPVVDCPSGKSIARGAGLFSHYRLLDAETRYGTAAWDWTSQSQRLADGTVQVHWRADEAHPFDLTAAYKWAAPHVLDVTTSVVARKDLLRFESFLACYFEGFPASYVYVKKGPDSSGDAGFFEAKKSFAAWQIFPRDAAAEKTILDGRWARKPNPVGWRIAPELAAPLAMRRDAESGLAGIVMAPPDDCFTVATPFGEESHRSLYLSLLGRDVKSGEKATARSRLVIARDLSDQQVIALYQAYLNEL
ncbi:MAG: hypothetical protein ACC628_17365 [Pirellulaceae bacterium]